MLKIHEHLPDNFINDTIQTMEVELGGPTPESIVDETFAEDLEVIDAAYTPEEREKLTSDWDPRKKNRPGDLMHSRW
jgi:hypothetical protein